MDIIIIAVIAAGGLILGALITFLIIKMANKGKAAGIIKDAETKGDVIIKEKNLLAKEKFLQLKAEHEKSINEKKCCDSSGRKQNQAKRTICFTKAGTSNSQRC